ncbi:MAG: MobA/MobL family protein [Sphingorhabdus sp.]
MTTNPKTITFRPFSCRPVIAASKHRATHRTAYASYCYIRREPDVDAYGPMPSEWAERGDLVATGRTHPAQTPAWARSGPRIWKEADTSITPHTAGEAAAFHIVLSLPTSEDASGWQYLVETFCSERLAALGMAVDWAIHFKPDEIAPHAHLLVTARYWRRDRTPGRAHPRWLAGENAVRTAELAWIELAGLKEQSMFAVKA